MTPARDEYTLLLVDAQAMRQDFPKGGQMAEIATKPARLTPSAHELVRQLAFVQRRSRVECLAEAVEEWAARQPETETLGLKVSTKTEEGT